MDDDDKVTGGAPAKGSTKVAAIGDNVSPTFRESEDTPSTLLNAQQNCLTHAVDVSYLVVVVVVVYKTAKLLTDFISVSSFSYSRTDFFFLYPFLFVFS